jgi:hypothetical protein
MNESKGNDLIYRHAAIDAATGWDEDPSDEDIEYAINTVAAIKAKPVISSIWHKTGIKNIYGGIEIRCSNCGFKVCVSPEHYHNLFEYERYCCHCGAEMVGEAE